MNQLTKYISIDKQMSDDIGLKFMLDCERLRLFAMKSRRINAELAKQDL
jgi:hypothetical protein